MRRTWGWLRWGVCAMRSPLAACRRRVGALDGVIPPRLVAVSSQFAVVSWPNCRPIGGKSPKMALLAEWVCSLAELVGVDASIALFGAASQADASRICQLGSTTGTLNPLMRS